MINQVICGDCREVMNDIPDNCIDMVLTSPPYDELRLYDGYSFDFKSVAKQLYRVVKEGGVVVWIVGDATIKGSETGTSFKQAIYFKEIGFNLHDTMIWEKQTFTATGALKTRYAQVFEYMFIFTKGKIKTFNPIKDRLNKLPNTIKHGTIRQIDGTTKPQSSLGKKANIYGQRFNVWKINTEVSNSNRFHPAQFSEKLAEDHILSWSNEEDIILDPMAGSGTTLKMAKKNNRNYIGIEISPKYIDIINKRLNGMQEGIHKLIKMCFGGKVERSNGRRS
jgi:site-specific DNA-methyltransferase (adenine-specific)